MTANPERYEIISAMYPFISGSFNASSVLMVLASATNNKTQKLIAQVIIATVMILPILDGAKKYDNIRLYSLASYISNFFNIFNSTILNCLDIETSIASTLLSVILSTIVSIACDKNMKDTWYSLLTNNREQAINEIYKEPATFLRLWKSISGSLKTAIFSSVSDNPSSNTAVEYISCIDPIVFIGCYSALHHLSPDCKITLPQCNKTLGFNTTPVIVLFATEIYAIWYLARNSKLMTTLTIVDFIALFIESSSMLLLQKNESKSPIDETETRDENYQNGSQERPYYRLTSATEEGEEEASATSRQPLRSIV